MGENQLARVGSNERPQTYTNNLGDNPGYIRFGGMFPAHLNFFASKARTSRY
jgi:hypothetical protein